ncbi:MAG: hypothetical protein HY976_04165 [Candidatus Kerfeldbacteria bacterium]|nr:hypothetical protein [Candidatus Kerfeldbacteria bacterium]
MTNERNSEHQPASLRRRLFVFRLVVWLVPVALMIWIIDHHVAFSGEVVLRCNAERCDPAIRNFASKDSGLTFGSDRRRTESYRIVTADPFYFDTQLLRSMQRADIKLTYQDPGDDRMLRLGVFMPGSFYQYYDFAAEHPNLVKLEETWTASRFDDTVLFQNPDRAARKYTSLDEFFIDPPATKQAATYNFEASARLHLSGYQPNAAGLKITDVVRGSHTLLAYLGPGETLKLKFQIQDMNRVRGRDDVSVAVLRGSELLTRTVLRDDGDESASGLPSSIRDVSVEMAAPGEGAYRIQITTNRDDSLIRTITSAQTLLMFEKRLYLAGSQEYQAFGQVDDRPMTLFVQGKSLTIQTGHVKSLQTVTVGSRKVKLAKTNTPVTIKLPTSTAPIQVTVPIRDVILSSNDATFSLSPQNSFSLQSVDFQDVRGLSDLSKIDYVIAKYQPLEQVGTWSVAELSLPSIPAGPAVHFLINGDPALSPGDPIRVKELEIRLHGERLSFGQLWQTLRSVISGIRKGN